MHKSLYKLLLRYNNSWSIYNKGEIWMTTQNLHAPESYNLVEEIERYATGEGKLAIHWENDQGEKKEITYDELIKQAVDPQGLMNPGKVLP